MAKKDKPKKSVKIQTTETNPPPPKPPINPPGS
jgi:hypothetical protein